MTGGSLDPGRLVAIFDAAVERSGDAREAFLEHACGGDPALEAEIRGLLAAHDAAGNFLDEPITEIPPTALGDGITPAGSPVEIVAVARDDGDRPSSADDTDLGRRIGPWRTVEQIGRGGMGVVYRARRDDGAYDADVALKLLPPGAGRSMHAKRLERERSVLASLVHPSIARLIDGGRTDDDRPWLAMELVEGRRLDAAADERRLGISGRVTWIRDAAEAAAHAHRRLVVHRDLKPSNVLVRQDTPVLLDFGVARVLGETTSDVTGAGPAPMTPRYAAPEQQRGEPPTVRVDVFALGMMLHTLLVGAPSDPDRGLPADPALAFGRLDPAARTSIASLRGASTASLERVLRGDLGRIVVAATQASPGDRYADAAALAEDLDRWLEGRPALAARPGRLRFMVAGLKRHRVATAFASVAALGLATGIAGLAVGLDRAADARDEARAALAVAESERTVAESERATAEATEAFLQRLLGSARLERVAAGRVPASELRVLDLLDSAGPAAASELVDQPAIESRVLRIVGEALHGYGEWERAIPHLRRAYELAETARGPDHDETIRALGMLGRAEMRLGRHDDAERHLRMVVDRRSRLDGSESSGALMALNDLGRGHLGRGDDERARILLTDVAESARTLLGPDHAVTMFAMSNLATVAVRGGDYDRAIELRREVRERLAASVGPDHPRTLNAHRIVALTYASASRFEEARDSAMVVLERSRLILGEEHYVSVTTAELAAQMRYRSGDESPEVLESHTAAIAGLRRALGDAHDVVHASVLRHANMRRELVGPADARVFLGGFVAESADDVDLAARAPELLELLEELEASPEPTG